MIAVRSGHVYAFVFHSYMYRKSIKKADSLKEFLLRPYTLESLHKEPGFSHHNFWEDLYYRLNVREIYIPPLRDRKEDIELLENHIVDRHCIEMAVKRQGISKDAMILMTEYDWLGNVRELVSVIERAILLSQGDRIDREHIPLRSRKNPGKEKRQIIPIKQGFKEMIEVALNETNSNISAAARKLNIDRSTLYRKIREFDIIA